MKKLLALLLALAMIFALAACGESDDKDDGNGRPASSDTEKPKDPASDSIVGTWTWSIKMTGDMMGYEGMEAGLDMTIKETFAADGKCTISVDADKMVASYPAFEAALIDYMIENMFDGDESIRGTLEQEFENQDMCGQLVELYGSMSEETTYTIEGNKLTVKSTDSDQPDEVYTFVLSGNTLELTPMNDETRESMETFGVDKLILKRV